jgi:hypothetical protein
MDTQIIDQSPSEIQLHRVLYIIKFLRAMVLHLILAIFAALLYFVSGIDGLYPIANNLIHALRAQSIQNQLEGGPIGSSGFVLVLSALVVILLAALIWIYVSITNVRRSALKLQAVLILIVTFWNVTTTWPNLRFAFVNLDFLFALLATVSVAVTLLIFPVSVAIALWGVARSPERSSLLATLDRRLAPNFWVYLNKLVDLPRTPLRTVGTGTAYVVALAGTLLLIASMMHLITVGGTSNKLAVLAIACGRDLMSRCVAISSVWAREISFSLLLALAGVKAAALLQSFAKRLGGLSVSDVIKNADDQFLLYLRPFDTDDVILPRPRLPLISSLFSFRPFPVRIEEELFDVADGYKPLIAVGKPGGSKAVLGGLAYRAYLDDSEWQKYVADKIRRANRIVILIKNTDGVRWELTRVIGEGVISKTLFLIDPAVRDAADWETLARTVVALLEGAGVAPQGFEFQSQPIGFFFQRGALVEIVNTNRTATSYRTAFSHFLAESLG